MGNWRNVYIHLNNFKLDKLNEYDFNQYDFNFIFDINDKYFNIKYVNQYNTLLMKPVKNIDSHDIDFPFEGNIYHLPQNEVVLVENAFYEFLKENFPLSFAFSVKVDKDNPVVAAKKTKAPVLTARKPLLNDMVVTSGRVKNTFVPDSPDVTPASGTVDPDGVGWYGEGLVEDNLN